MDEVDSALDQAYRQSTSKVIHELSRNAQFITTTFRPEMLERADAFYGVYFDKQKVSTISQISREDAQKFVETAAEGPATK
jgi:structural maintenance of chromosome 3 (chondroitin sulfate proteoglycan 6)